MERMYAGESVDIEECDDQKVLQTGVLSLLNKHSEFLEELVEQLARDGRFRGSGQDFQLNNVHSRTIWTSSVAEAQAELPEKEE